LAEDALRRLAVRRRAARHARPAAPHERARPQCLADPLGQLRVRRFLGRGVGAALRVLPQIYSPHFAVPHQFRRGPAGGDGRRLGDAGRAGGWGRDRHAPQELRLGVHRALEHAARPGFRPHRGVHAGGRRSRGEKTVAALRLQNLRKSFGGLPAISDVSLEVAPGERRLIIGPNGAGKTTLFNLVTGDLLRDAGNVILFEEDVTRLAPHHRVHRGLARTYQIITLLHYGRGIVEGTRAEVVADPTTLDVYLGHRGSHVAGGRRSVRRQARAAWHLV